jgi:hypothetical protein
VMPRRSERSFERRRIRRGILWAVEIRTFGDDDVVYDDDDDDDEIVL